jgi:UDP-2,3-diacylglucosamine pyrophosphatase LpxH
VEVCSTDLTTSDMPSVPIPSPAGPIPPVEGQQEELVRATRDARYHRRVAVALDRSLAEARAEEPITLDIRQDRWILFSDLHRGARNRADDFRWSERSYNAALAWYHTMGHVLAVLGDADELWQERAGVVIEAYRHTLELEARFHREGRYLRLWGNHDDAWGSDVLVRLYLDPVFGEPRLKPREHLLIRVVDGAEELGTLFLVHGHQGTGTSDKWSRLARIPVRYVWRNVQRATGYGWSTPATDWRLRARHNIALYSWAQRQSGLVLIAGHTHRPVFKSRSHADQLQEELQAAERALEAEPGSRALLEAVGSLVAELEWVRTQEYQRSGPEGTTEMEVPAYFNTGCCSFRNGHITGIEIAEGEIRLVRWPDDGNRPRPSVLARSSLRGVLEACR